MKNVNKKICSIFLALFLFLTFANTALAQESLLDQQEGMTAVSDVYGQGVDPADPRIIVAKIIRISLTLIAMILVCLIIYSGFMWMTAGGNEEQITKAKARMMNAVIGTLIVLAAWSITLFVLSRLRNATIEPAGSTMYLNPWN